MKNEFTPPQNDQDDEYNGKEGCFALLFGGILLLLAISVILNIALIMKLYQ